MSSNHAIRVPIAASDLTEFVGIFPDELPDDFYDVIDVLRSELAPLKVWKSCAVEYHRQGFHSEFELILNDIVESLTGQDVEKIYKSRQDYAEGMVEIFSALAAKELSELARLKDRAPPKPHEEGECAKRVVDFLKRAESHARINEYTWLIKGFYEIRQGELKRAEENFKAVYNRTTKGQNISRRKFLFGALVGLGIVAFGNQKYSTALENFCKAVQSHPSCGTGIRVAIANCCFRLGQYERAKYALDKALSLDPTNADCLVLLSLLERVAAQKDRSKRIEHFSNANEYCQVAQAIDPSNANALNHMANHCFHAWKVLSGSSSCEFIGVGQLSFGRVDSEDICVGDLVRVDGSVFTVTSINAASEGSVAQSDKVIVSVEGSGDLHSLKHALTVELKEYGKVTNLARKAYEDSTVSFIRAESLYIIGRVFHAQGKQASALDYYRRALAQNPDLTLASFGVGQLLLAQQDLPVALESFEKVLKKHPDDRDTQAYILLLRALVKKESGSFEKVREIAPGFLHEIDLWLLQGQLRQGNVLDYSWALKCYTQALECMEQRNLQPDSRVLSNIAVLHHALGRPTAALQFCKKALKIEQEVAGSSSYENPIFRSSDLDGVFYSWSTPTFTVEPDWSTSTAGQDSGASEGSSCSLCNFSLIGDDGDTMDLTSIVSPGEDLCLTLKKAGDTEVQQPVIHQVVSVSKHSLSTRCVFHGVLLQSEESRHQSFTFSVSKRVTGKNFNDQTTTLCYNFARILEDIGRTKAASEVYVQLLKQHPSFIDCYLRLSRIARDVGKLDEASVWLSRALAIEDTNADAGLSLGDLYARGQHWDDAKKCYEKICTKNEHDSRTMISLGNMYFANIASNPERYRKDSYKFFHHVLSADPKNVYAANGLGMVCAEMGELETAREIISRAREANMSLSEDVCANLAHVHLAQGRLIDAEHLYQAALKMFPKSNGSGGGMSTKQSDKLVAAHECMAHAQFRHGRHEDALKSLFKGLHSDPTCLRDWYNVAIVRADLGMSVMKRSGKSSTDIGEAISNLQVADQLFSFLSTTNLVQGRGVQYDKKVALKKATICKTNVTEFGEELKAVLDNEKLREEGRLQQERDHQLRLQLKLHEKERVMEEAESMKREQQRTAADRRKKLEEMREKWKSSHTSSSTSEKEARAAAPEGKQSSKRRRRNNSRVNNDVDDDDQHSDKGFDSGNERDTSDEANRPTEDLDDIFGEDSDVEDTASSSHAPKRTIASSEADSEEPSGKRSRAAADDEDGSADF